jgi:hypothetical protein
LLITEKLYGREREIDALLAAFDPPHRSEPRVTRHSRRKRTYVVVRHGGRVEAGIHSKEHAIGPDESAGNTRL